MSNYFRPGNDGIVEVPGLNVSSVLYIKGKKFEDYINELVSEDQLEQGEIDEIKLLLLYLNTSGLSSEWIVDNNNKNQDLKTAITALQTKLAQIDTGALTQPSFLNNENRNSVLKTRLDGHDTNIGDLIGRVDGNDSSIATLNGKTRYITATVGDNNANPKTFSQHQVMISNTAQKRRILLSTYPSLPGAFNFNITSDETIGQVGDEVWAENNRINMMNQNGNIEIEAKKTHILGRVEIGEFSDVLVNREPINIGGSMSRINIGSVKDAKVGTGPGDPDTADSTIINIGKSGAGKNTWTNLRGNIYTSDARFESMSRSQQLSLTSFLSLVTSAGIPLYINIIGALGMSNYIHNDLWHMTGSVVGNLVKTGEVATTNDIKVKSYSLYNTDATFQNLFPIENTFIASGSSSKTLLLGSIKEQVFNNASDITLKHNNVAATSVDWVLSEANDNVNTLCIKGNDGILLHQGASSSGASFKILNSKAGKIELLLGNAGTKASCLTGVQIDWNGGLPQTIIGSKVALQNAQQNNSKLLVQQTDQAGHVGIEVVKANQAAAPLFRTTISDSNIDTHSVSLRTNFTGTTTKTLYLDGTDNLKFGANFVTPVKDIIAGSHISVTNNNGVYTIAKTGGGGGGIAELGEDLIISATAVQLPRKSNWYGNRFLQHPQFTRQFYDVYMSASGKYIFWANRSSIGTPATILYSAAYMNDSFWYEGRDNDSNNIEALWITVCGTTEGSRVWAIGSNQIWTASPNMAFFSFTQATTPPNFAGATPVQMRCNGDGEYQLITDARAGSFGAIYKSNDYGATWTQQNITNLNSHCIGCAVNASGKTQYVVCDGTNSFQNIENGVGGVYRSEDYGATWAKVLGTTHGNHQRLHCDATGRYVCVVGSGHLYTSKDYGATWINFGFTLTRSVWVSRSGDYMWVGRFATSDTFIYSNDFGQSFQYGNYPVGSNYVGMANDCIACNNDGSIVVSGSISGLRINTCREFPNDVRQLQGSTNIQIIELGEGAYRVNWVAPTNTASGPTKVNLSFNQTFTAGVTTNNVNFNMPTTYALSSYRMTGKIVLSVDTFFDYPAIRFNGQGTIGVSSAQRDEQTWSKIYEYTGANNGMATLNLDGYLSRDPIFAHMQNNANTQILLSFEIDLMNQVSPREPIMVCKGSATYGTKGIDGTPTYRAVCFFERWSNQTSINQISINNWTTNASSIQYASLDLDVIPIPTFNTI